MNQEKKYYVYEMNGVTLQIISVIFLIIMLFITFFFFNEIIMSDKDFELIFLLIIPYLILHELLHSLAYVINGAKFKNITYGAHLEKGILCCLCKQNISKRNILISLLFPFVIIGVITYIIGILTNNTVLIWLSILNISGCSADLIMFFDLLKLKDFEYSEYDNPMAFGLYTNKDLSKTKLFGLKYIKQTKELEKHNLKKVSISKTSIILFIIFIALVIWLIFLT